MKKTLTKIVALTLCGALISGTVPEAHAFTLPTRATVAPHGSVFLYEALSAAAVAAVRYQPEKHNLEQLEVDREAGALAERPKPGVPDFSGYQPGDPLVLKSGPTNGERYILGRVHQVLPPSGNAAGSVVLSEPRFAAQDFPTDQGRVTLPIDSSLQVVDGADGVLTVDAYLRRLPESERARFVDLFYAGQGHYAAEMTRLWDVSRDEIQALPASADKTLLLNLLDVRTEKEALALLHTTAIADLPTEIIRVARRLNRPRLIALQNEIKTIQDTPARSSEGFIRTHHYTVPGDRLLETLRARWGTVEPDIVVMGAGPTGIAQALLFGHLGFKVLLVDKGPAGATWSDKFNFSVHALRSPLIRNDVTFALFPDLERRLGFKDHLPFYRLLATQAREAVERLTGLIGLADSGLPAETRMLHSSEAVDVLAHPSTRGEVFFQLQRLLKHAVDTGNVVVLEDTPGTPTRDPSSGAWSVTLRTDRVGSPELTLPVRYHPHWATGFSGTRGEFARIPRIFEEWDREGTHTLIHDSFEMDLPSTLSALANAHTKPLIITAPLTGHPLAVAYYRGLPPDIPVYVEGDQESAIKSVKMQNDLNPRRKLLVNFAKRRPKATKRHFTAPQNRRGYVEEFLRNPEKNGPALLTEAERRASQVSQQSEDDYEALIGKGVLTVHVLDGKGFDNSTNPHLYQDVPGPWVIAVGYQSPEERLTTDPETAALLEQDALRLEDTLQPIPASDGWPLEFGHRGWANNPTYSGPVLQIIAIAFITGSFGFAWFHAYFNALKPFLLEHPGPARPLAVRNDGQTQPLTDDQIELYNQVLSLFHDAELYALASTRSRPTVVYEPSALPKARQDKLKARIPDGVVTYAPETDPARLGHLRYALNDEALVELIPGLRDALTNPTLLASTLAQELAAADIVPLDFGRRVLALQTWLAAHPGVTVEDAVLQPVDADGILVMDAADYQTLFQNRSNTRQVRHVYAPIPERFQGEPLIVRPLQSAFNAILWGFREPVATHQEVPQIAAGLTSGSRETDALSNLKPILSDYAVAAVQDAFNWNEVLIPLASNEWYLVVFRSQRKPNADNALLNQLDEAAHQEAEQSGGLLHYFRGQPTADGRCLSFCLWENQDQARLASSQPQHLAAAQAAPQMYESFALERYRVRKIHGGNGPQVVFERIASPDWSRRGFLSAVGLLPFALRTEAQQKQVQSPQISPAEAAAVERTNVVLLTEPQAEDAWNVGSDEAADLGTFGNLLKRVIRANQTIKGKFLEHRAEWSYFLAMLRSSKSLNVSSVDTHALRNTWYGKNFLDFRDLWGFTGLTVSDPKNRVEAYGRDHTDASQGFWRRLANKALAPLRAAAAGFQVTSKNVVEKGQLEGEEQAFEVNKAFAYLRETIQDIFEGALQPWFDYPIKTAFVKEHKAEQALADYRVRHAQDLERQGFGDPEAPGGSRDLLKNVAQPAKAEVDNAKRDLGGPWLRLRQVTASRPDDLVQSVTSSRPQGPGWTSDSLNRDVADFDAHLSRLITSEAYDVSDEEHAKNIQTRLAASDETPTTELGSGDLSGFPTLQQLFSSVPETLSLGASPKERALVLQRYALATVQTELLELQKKPSWQVGLKFQASTTPLLASLLNWNWNKPSESTVRALEERIQKVQLVAKSLDQEILAEQISVRAAFLKARAERRNAFIDLAHTRAAIALLQKDIELSRQDDAAHTTTLDRAKANLELEVLHRRSERQLVEALAAWKKMELYTPSGQNYIDSELESHYVAVLERLDAQVPSRPVNPPLPPKPTSRRGFLRGLAPVVGFAIASASYLTDFVTAASAQTLGEVPAAAIHAAAQGPVASAAQQIALDVVIGKYTGGSQNTLSGVAVNILKELHQSVSQSSILKLAHQIAERNGLKNIDIIPQGTLHVGSFDPAVAERLVAHGHAITAHAATAAPLQNAIHTAITQTASAASNVASAAPDSGAVIHQAVQTVTQIVPHPSLWANPFVWGTAAVVVVLVVGRLLIRRATRSSHRTSPLLALVLASAVFLGLGYATSSATGKTIENTEKKVVAAAQEKVKTAAENVAATQTENYGVGVIRDDHSITLPFDAASPGVISYVRPGFAHIAAHQALAAPESLPYTPLIQDINGPWKHLQQDINGPWKLQPNASVPPLLDPSLLGVSPADLKNAPFHIRYFGTGNSVAAQIRNSLLSMKQLVGGYAYLQAQGNKIRKEQDSSDLTAAEKTARILIDLEQDRLQILHQRFAQGVIRTERDIDVLAGSVVGEHTPVNTGSLPTTLFKVRDRAILRLSLSPEDMITLENPNPNVELRIVDQKGRSYQIRTGDIRLRTVIGGISDRSGSGAQPKTSSYERSAVGAEPTELVELEISNPPFPADVVPASHGFFPSSTEKNPIPSTLPLEATVVTIKLVDTPPTTFLHHPDPADVLQKEWTLVNKTKNKVQQLLEELSSSLPTDNPGIIAFVKDLEARQLDLEKTLLELQEQRAAEDVGVNDIISTNQLVVSPNPAADWDAGALSRTFPSIPEAEQRIVWKVGDVIRVQVKGTVNWGPQLQAGDRNVYFPHIDRTFVAHPLNTENADRAFNYPERTWEVELTLGRDPELNSPLARSEKNAKQYLSLREFQQLFHGFPNEHSVSYGYLTPASEQPAKSTDNSSTDASKQSSGSSSFSKILAWLSGGSLVGLIAAYSLPVGFLAGVVIAFTVLTLRRSKSTDTFAMAPFSAAALFKSIGWGLAAGAVAYWIIEKFKAKRLASRVNKSVTYLPINVNRKDAQAVTAPELDLVLDVARDIPGKLKAGTIKGPTRKTVLQPVRRFLWRFHEILSNRGFNTFIGFILFIGIPFYIILSHPIISAAMVRAAYSVNFVRELMPLLSNPVTRNAVIVLIVIILQAIFVSIPQRDIELILNVVMWPWHTVLFIFDYLISLPLWGINDFIHHWNHEERSDLKAKELDQQEDEHFLDLAILGHYFLYRALVRNYGSSDSLWAGQVLKAFEQYTLIHPDRRHPGSGPMEIVSPDEARLRLGSEGYTPQQITQAMLDQRRLQLTLEHVLKGDSESPRGRNSLAIRGLLALLISGLASDLRPTKEQRLNYHLGYALKALANATGLFPSVFSGYHAQLRKRKRNGNHPQPPTSSGSISSTRQGGGLWKGFWKRRTSNLQTLRSAA